MVEIKTERPVNSRPLIPAEPAAPAPSTETAAPMSVTPEAPAALRRSAANLNPSVSVPGAGAFDATLAPRPGKTASRLTWDGPIATSETLGEMAEQRFLSKAGDHAVVLPYRDFDPNRTPVVLFHGLMNPAADSMQELADRLHDAGKQVYVVYYRDVGEDVGKAGKEVARQLAAIRAKHYDEGTPLDAVGLCIGGVVARAALNYLQEPNWLGDGSDLASKPRGGFGNVRFRSVDTVWDGFFHEAPEKRDGMVIRVIKAILRWLGLGGVMELRATSNTFEHLYDVRLKGVDFQNLGVRKPQETSLFRSVPQYDAEEAMQLARSVLDGVVPKDVRVRNWSRALTQETRFPGFQRALAERVATEKLAIDRPSEALRRTVVELFEEAMPSYPVLTDPDANGKREMRSGWRSHVMGVKNDPSRDDDLFDTLLAELTGNGATLAR